MMPTTGGRRTRALASAALALLLGVVCVRGGMADPPMRTLGLFANQILRALPFIPLQPYRDCSVALYGDSILHGGFRMAQRLADPPAAALKRLLPSYRIVDRSLNGATAHVQLTEFFSEEFTTRFVVLQYGINDAGSDFPLELPLRTMIRYVQATGQKPLLTGLAHQLDDLPKRAEYDAIHRALANEFGAPFAQWGSIPFDRSDFEDPIHPAQAYSHRLVEQLALTLDRAAPECAG